MAVGEALKRLRSSRGVAQHEDPVGSHIAMPDACRQAYLQMLSVDYKELPEQLTCAQSSDSSLQNVERGLQLLIARS